MFLIDRLFAKVDQHLLTGRSIKYMVVDPTMIVTGIYLTGILQIVHVVAQRLFITGKRFVISVFYELLFQKIIDRGNTEVLAGVCLNSCNDGRLKRFDIKCFILGKLFAGIIRYHIHVEILGYGRTAGWFESLINVVVDDLGLSVTP